MPDACEIDHCDNNCAKCMWGKDIENKGLKLMRSKKNENNGVGLGGVLDSW